MENFANKIKELRLEKGWTQKEFAQRLGFAQSIISAWESNQKEPNFSSLKKICEVLGVSADYLLGLTDGY